MTKYLIVNSDDLGISEGVNRGILEGHLKGIVTSTSAMVNLPAARSGIQAAQKSAPKLGIGLHFTLSFGSPVCTPDSVPSLVTSEGRFVTTYTDLINKIESFTDADLERELSAQFQRFVELAGRKPDHMDSHHGAAYFHPASFDLMLRLAKEHGLPIRWKGQMYVEPQKKFMDKIEASIDKYGQPPFPEHFADFIFNFKSVDRLAPLQAGLRTLQDGYTEAMVHVGYAENLEEDYTFQREEELAAVTHPSVRQIIQEEGIHLVTFSDLPN